MDQLCLSSSFVICFFLLSLEWCTIDGACDGGGKERRTVFSLNLLDARLSATRHVVLETRDSISLLSWWLCLMIGCNGRDVATCHLDFDSLLASLYID